MRIFSLKCYIIFSCFTLFVMLTSCSENEVSNEETTTIPETLTIAEEILQLVNDHRLSIGQNPLQTDDLATILAIEHTNYMIAQNDISHDDFNERSNRLITEANATRTGENVAVGQRTAQEVMTAWLNSTGHRRNIEGDFTHIGIGAIQNSSGRYYFTQLFLKKREAGV